MKTLALILTLTTIGCASTPFEDWSKRDTYRQLAYSAVLAVDWLQTRQGICGSDKYEELNPYLSKDPSRSEIDLYMGATMLVQPFVAGMVAPEYRPYYQSIMIGFESGIVYSNYKIGVKIDF